MPKEKTATTNAKKKYDIIKGQWVPREKMRIPGTNQDFILKWEFTPEGNPVKTGVPMDEKQVEEFNASRKLRTINAYTEQIVPAGSKATVYDELENPYELKKL